MPSHTLCTVLMAGGYGGFGQRGLGGGGAVPRAPVSFLGVSNGRYLKTLSLLHSTQRRSNRVLLVETTAATAARPGRARRAGSGGGGRWASLIGDSAEVEAICRVCRAVAGGQARRTGPAIHSDGPDDHSEKWTGPRGRTRGQQQQLKRARERADEKAEAELRVRGERGFKVCLPKAREDSLRC